MKVSDYIAAFLAKEGVHKAFVLTGGCAVHIIDSIAKQEGIDYVAVQHEQGGAMAADAYARISGDLGVAVVTSGPGATNLLTGVCCSYYDSIPVLLITGQVPKGQLKGKSESRQIGFQETDVVSIYESVTKYAKLVDDPAMVRYELEKAVYIARQGRQGPVLLDICDDIQREEIEPENLDQFDASDFLETSDDNFSKIIDVIELINKAERPVAIVGGGVRSRNTIKKLHDILQEYAIPYTLTWAAMDYYSHDNELYVGGFGGTSGRPGNFAVQNADLILAIGTRLDTHEVGSNIKTFARAAKKITVDIDISEQTKYAELGMHVDVLVNSDSSMFVDLLKSNSETIERKDRQQWINKITEWKERYPICLDEYKEQPKNVNPYVFMKELSFQSNAETVVVTDCGSNLIWTMQGFSVNEGQRLVSAFNHSPMGYSLPASIGAKLADPARKVVCITGDGGLQINIQEFATIAYNQIDIKIFVLNNHGYGIIQGTQDAWLEGRHHASDTGFGLPDPDFLKIAEAYGIESVPPIRNHNELSDRVDAVLNSKGPTLCVVELESGSQIMPKLLFGRPIEDSHPLLPREEFEENMIVEII